MTLSTTKVALIIIVLSWFFIPKFCVNSPRATIEPTSVLGREYDFVRCHGSDVPVKRFIPTRSLKTLKDKGLGNLGDFEVRYTGFTPEAQAAFQYAVDIWDSFIDSDSKIIVDASFQDLGSGVLGSAAPTALYADFSDKVDVDIEYTIAIAEKILGVSLNGDNADLRCNFNSISNWYYDTDNPDQIESNQHDFATVVLHELGHGLGFLSRHSFVTASGLGFLGTSPPITTDIFSLLLEKGDGTNLILNYEDASVDMGSALLSEDVYLHSHHFVDDSIPKIYAPSSWSNGSSISHLDEFTFNNSDPLMTPSISTQEVIHDPEISLDMMNDMGWRSSFIAHRAANRELSSGPLTITADVTTDEGVGFDSSSVVLIYSQDSFRLTTDTLPMNGGEGTSSFSAELPLNGVERYQYAIIINDSINRGYSSPLLAPQRFHDIRFGVDLDAPEIIHENVDLLFLNEGNPILVAQVTDEFTGVDTVLIEYSINQGLLQAQGLVHLGFTNYEITIDISSLGLVDGDMLSYRIIARDHAMTTNESSLPEDGFFDVGIKAVPDAIETYINDFNSPTTDFSGIDFSVREEDGFDDGALHSTHPYPTAGGGNELNLITRLRKPIKVIDQGRIEFDEVVLVEPSEPGSLFGDDDFWDYVIVEASKDNGATWIPLLRGYDSRDKTLWKNNYDAGLSGQISSAVGSQSLLFKKSFRLHQPSLGINVDDEIVLRWRLYSDPFAGGWGWVIDNLEIQKADDTTPTIKVEQADESIVISPNPIGDELLNISINKDIRIRRIQIYDTSGRLHYNRSLEVLLSESIDIDVSDLDPGVYHVLLETKGAWLTKPILKY